MSDDPGVSAFHAATIGGPEAWLSATVLGGVFAGTISKAGSLMPKTPFEQSRIAQRTLPNQSGLAVSDEAGTRVKLTDQPDLSMVLGDEIEVRIISADEQSGHLTADIQHPTTSEIYIMDGNAYTGDAIVMNMTTGEVAGYFRAGKFEPSAFGGELTAASEVGPVIVGGEPVPAGVSIVEDVPVGPGPLTQSPGTPGLAPRRIIVGAQDLAAMRGKYGIGPEQDTIALARTDVPALSHLSFEGASRTIRQTAAVPQPTPHIVSPRSSPHFTDHAEQDIVNHFIDAVNGARLRPSDLEGRVLAMHISHPSGVCSACRQGLTGSVVEPGVLLQLSQRYKGLTIRVTWETADGSTRGMVIVGGSIY
jgi:hypothetical protein